MGTPGGSAGWAIYRNLSPEGTALVPERHCNFWSIVTNAAHTIPFRDRPCRMWWGWVPSQKGLGNSCSLTRHCHAGLSHAVPAALSRVVRMAYAELLHAVSPSQTNGQKSRRPLKGSLVHTQSEIPGFQPNTESIVIGPIYAHPLQE